MTPREFDLWWADATTRWPSLQSWLTKCFPASPQQVAFLRTWREVLADVGLADCLDVNRQMQSGALERVGEHDTDRERERLPQHVRRLAKQLARDRNPQRQGDLSPLGPIGSGFPAPKILRRMWELQERGMSREDAKAQALAEFPIGQSMCREPRYDCHLCLDTGVVLVATGEAMNAMAAGTFERCHHRLGVVRCKCKSHLPANPRRPIATYDAGLCFKIADPLWGQAETRRFAEWVAVQQERRAEELAKSAPNYEPAFAEFNR